MCVQSQIYKIDELVSLAHPRDGHQKVFAMIEAFLDESGIHKGSKVCIIAGYFGGPGQLRQLEREWKAILKKFHFPMEDFHAKELIKTEKYWPMLNELANMVGKQRKVYPVSYGIVVDDFFSFPLNERRFLTGAVVGAETGRLTTSGCPSKAYFVPFQNVIKIITDAAPVGGKAHFSFGIDSNFSGYAVALFQQMVEYASHKRPEQARGWKSRDRLGTPLFPKASETPQLQAADLFVHARYLQMLSPNQDSPPRHVAQILTGCLGNSRTRKDHVFQNKECLQEVIEEMYSIAPAWREKVAENKKRRISSALK